MKNTQKNIDVTDTTWYPYKNCAFPRYKHNVERCLMISVYVMSKNNDTTYVEELTNLDKKLRESR